MLRTTVGAVAAAWMIGLPSPVAAQTMATSVTFTMPVNLTQLSPDLERVRLLCAVLPSDVLKYPQGFGQTSDALPKDELYVVAGQLVATMRVVFPIAAEWLSNPIGKTAEYNCGLQGFSKSLQRWDGFSETSTVPAFMLKPLPTTMKGTFVW